MADQSFLKRFVLVGLFLNVVKLGSLCGPSTAAAADLFSRKDSDSAIQDIVRERLFPGGKDDEPLQVQETLTVPYRSVDLMLIHRATLNEVVGDQAPSQSEYGDEDAAPAEEE